MHREPIRRSLISIVKDEHIIKARNEYTCLGINITIFGNWNNNYKRKKNNNKQCKFNIMEQMCLK